MAVFLVGIAAILAIAGGLRAYFGGDGRSFFVVMFVVVSGTRWTHALLDQLSTWPRMALAIAGGALSGLVLLPMDRVGNGMDLFASCCGAGVAMFLATALREYRTERASQ